MATQKYINEIRLANLKVLASLLIAFKNDNDSLNIKRTEACVANNDAWPIDKTSRWIGYLQRALEEKGHSVDSQRNFTRPIFHAAYKAAGLDIPASVKVVVD